jgi:hypothetical protein
MPRFVKVRYSFGTAHPGAENPCQQPKRDAHRIYQTHVFVERICIFYDKKVSVLERGCRKELIFQGLEIAILKNEARLKAKPL